MSAVAYTVTATFPDQATAGRYLAWLEDGHVDAVIRHGAHSGMIIRIEDPSEPIRVETRYIFPTRQTFETYLRDGAPALRAEGVRLFPPGSGVSFERRTGSVV